MSFQNVMALMIMAGVFFLCVLTAVLRLVIGRGKARLAPAGMEKRLTASISSGRSVARVLMFVTAAISAVLALGDPRWGFQEREVKSTGQDIVIALDTSLSMQTRDILPDRLTKAKMEIANILPKLQGDRIALLVFSGAAAVMSPLTADTDAYSILLESVSIGMLGDTGTDLGGALRAAVPLFKKEENRYKVIILITDGEDRGKGLDEAVRLAKQNSVRVFSVGIGTEKGEPIPVLDERGQITGYKKDKSGAVVTSVMKAEILKKISKETRGGFYRATPDQFELERVYQAVRRMKGREMNTFLDKHKAPRFYIFTAIAAGALFFFILLYPYRRIYS